MVVEIIRRHAVNLITLLAVKFGCLKAKRVDEYAFTAALTPLIFRHGDERSARPLPPQRFIHPQEIDMQAAPDAAPGKAAHPDFPAHRLRG